MVAISKEPSTKGWIVRTGQKGKRMRVNTLPNATGFDELVHEFVGDDYHFISEGTIDTRGNPILDSYHADLYWEVCNLDVPSLRDDLKQFAYRFGGGSLEYFEDIDGCRFKQDRVVFGIGNKAGLINYDGIGAGNASFAQSDICCVIAFHARTHDISLTAGDDRKLTPEQAIGLSMQHASADMLEHLHTLGVTSLRHTLSSLSKKQITF